MVGPRITCAYKHELHVNVVTENPESGEQKPNAFPFLETSDAN